MKIYSIYILNKAGGLIYQNDINPGLNRLTANDYLVLAGTLHGVHAITAKFTTPLNPQRSLVPNTINSNIITSGKAHNPNVNKTGLESIETDSFNLYVFQTLTGVKFIIITSPVTASPMSRGELNNQLESINQYFKHIYVLYSDYVMKDPFYSLDMPIKNPLFDSEILELIN